ncbi:MAG: iron ABC transporter permease [Acidimicrobiales bacterium]|nr:iron ABC transporter permease [Acidimicrobiales bacterium]
MDRDRPALISVRGLLLRATVVAVPLAFFALFFAYPVGAVVFRGATEGSVLEVIRRPSTIRLLWFTSWQAAVSTLLALAVGLPAAWAVSRVDLPGKRLLRAFLIVPFVLPTLVVGAAVQALSAWSGLGLDGTVAGILVAHTMLNAAVVIRIVGGSWSLLDPSAEEAARTLGASRATVLREVTLPALAPALWSAAGIVFLFCFTSFGVILTVGGPGLPTIETEIWRQAVQRTDFSAAAALSVLQIVVVVALVVVTNALERRAQSVTVRRPAKPAPARSWRRRSAVAAALAPAVVLLIVPLGLLVEQSFAVSGGGHGLANYRALRDTSAGGLFVPAAEAIGNSLTAAVWATAVAVLVGGIAAAAVVYSRSRTGRMLDVALMVPLGTSAVTIGFGILLALGRPPLDLRSSWVIVPLAQALVGTPFVIRTSVAGLRSVDRRQQEAAAVLGATPSRVRLTVDLPVAARSLLVGAAFAFAVSLGEFGATSFLARPDRPTIPVAMFRLLGRPSEALHGQAMALGVVLAVLSLISVMAIERLRPTDRLGW